MDNKNSEEVNRKENVAWSDGDSNQNQHKNLGDKWNQIQEEYLAKYSELDTEDLYFESGGFQGLLQKIGEVRNESIEEIRSEIENW